MARQMRDEAARLAADARRDLDALILTVEEAEDDAAGDAARRGGDG